LQAVSNFSASQHDSGIPVVLLHGLYMGGLLMRPLAARLRRQGWRAETFTYRSLWEQPEAVAERLRTRLLELGAPRVHLVGHSLGGLVLRLALAEWQSMPNGRVVTLGTPHAGCHTTRSMAERGLERLVGRAASALLSELPPWCGQRELGSIAGTVGMGLGRAFPGLASPNDGSVAVQETLLPGMSDHICLPVSHSSMLISPLVATQCHTFLKCGRFRRDAAKC
jgi:pimeloyl-ACP methyl ester carboxylesterase